MKKRIMENIDGVEVVKMVEVRVPSERKRDRAKAFKQLHIDDMYDSDRTPRPTVWSYK